MRKSSHCWKLNKGIALFVLVSGCISLAMVLAIQIKKSVTATSEDYQNKQSNRSVILIDPGHGGKDGGAIASDGTVEKEINLAISLPLADMLQFLGYSVETTRSSDKMLCEDGLNTIREQKVSDMKNRLVMYNNSQFVLSIHQNHFSQSQYYGIQLFYGLKSQDSAEAAKTLREVMLPLLQPENKRELKKATNDIFLLHNATVPAVLIECGFLSNEKERQQLKNRDYQQKMAYAIACGVLQYNP